MRDAVLLVVFAYGLPIGSASTLGAAGGLHADAVDDERCGDDAGDGECNRRRLDAQAADVDVLHAVQERGIEVDPVALGDVRIARCAADAGSTCVDAPAHAAVPADGAAV